MKIHQLFVGNSLRNFSYIIETKTGAICIDTTDAKLIISFLEKNNLILKKIINTHEHFDHIEGNEELVKKYSCEILAHKDSKFKVDFFLTPGNIIPLDENNYFKILNTPGHTFAHICLLLVENEKAIGIFTGDTLFNAGVGNCYGGNSSVLYKTIKCEFDSLNDDLKVYPGHDYFENNCNFSLNIEPTNIFIKNFLEKYHHSQSKGEFYITTMQDERKINPFLRLDFEEIKNQIQEKFKLSNLSNKGVFLKLRELRNNW